MSKDAARRLVERQIEKIPELKANNHRTPEFEPWRQQTLRIIKRIFGEDSDQAKQFDSIGFGLIIFGEETPESAWREAYHQGLAKAEATLKSFIEELELFEPARAVTSETKEISPDASNRTWDLFICHASEDKDEVARPLAQALASQGLSVWYDEFTLTLGDGLSRKIDEGLANSRFGVVILSPSFFKKEWPRRELDGLAAKEVSSGKTILPIWHNVNRDYVLRYSPVLADKLAVSTEEGLDKIVADVLKAIRKANTRGPSRQRNAAQLVSFLGEKHTVPSSLAVEEPYPEKPAGPAFGLALFQIATYLVAFSWFSLWILGQPGWLVDFLIVSGAVVIVVVYGKSIRELQIVRWCRRTFPIFVTASILCLLGSVGLAYTLLLYPALSGLTFATHLTSIPTVSAYLLLATLGGGVVLDLPRLNRSEIGNSFTWIRHHRRFFIKGAGLALLVMVVCANLAYIDTNLVLFTQKIGFVETRYGTDGYVHIYQIGLMTFGAWSQDQQIVHVMISLFPLVSEEYYWIATNSTMPPSILGASGLSATILTPPISKQDKTIVRLQSFAPAATDPQFSMQFYSELDVKQLAYIDLSPGSVIQQFPNGTQQWQRQFAVVNHSAYDLRLERIILCENGYAPTNKTMIFSPPEVFPHPDLSYENSRRTLALYGAVYHHGNLTVTVTYNSY